VFWKEVRKPSECKATRNKYPTHLAGLFARLLRCRNSFLAGYVPIYTPGRQTKILRNMGRLFIARCLSNLIQEFRTMNGFCEKNGYIT